MYKQTLFDTIHTCIIPSREHALRDINSLTGIRGMSIDVSHSDQLASDGHCSTQYTDVLFQTGEHALRDINSLTGIQGMSILCVTELVI